MKDFVAKMAQLVALNPLVRAVASEHSVPTESVMGRSRSQAVVAARTDAWRRLRALGWSYSEIARAWGRHPSTVLRVLNGRDRSPRQ